MPPRNIWDSSTIIREFYRFLQPGLISTTIFEEKLRFPTANHKRIYKLNICFFLPLNHAIHKIGNTANILCRGWKEREESHFHFIFYWSCSKLSRFHQWTNQSSYSFNIPFKMSLKAIVMGASSQIVYN